jgi:hypothetical protein
VCIFLGGNWKYEKEPRGDLMSEDRDNKIWQASVWLLIEIMNMFNIHSYIDPIESNSRFKVA